MLSLLLSACSPEAPPAPVAASEPAVATVGEALAGRCPDPDPGAVVPPGDDLHRVTLSDSPARCNDGSPPVMYVRAATDPEHAADWVIHLEGGGLCEDAETCADRWCGTGPGPYDAGKMSSAWSPPTAGGRGLASTDPRNAFAGHQQVEVQYCSSDVWIGAEPQRAFEGDTPYRLAFEGHGIVLAVLDALSAGVTSDDGAQTLPPLTGAERVVWSGSSAGAVGAIHHADRVAERLPGAAVVLASDSGFTPASETFPGDLQAAHVAHLERNWREIAEAVWSAWLDPDCLATVDAPWRCSDLALLLRERVTVPVALHHDLRDPVLYSFIAPIGVDRDTYAAASAATLQLLREERPTVSIHASSCAQHTAMDDDRGFLGLQVTDRLDGPPARTPHDVLLAVSRGERALAVDEVDGRGSRCE